jgi:DNA-binding beta-propeller fold protein YncE
VAPARSLLTTLLCLSAFGAEYRAPAGDQTAIRRPGATTILPGGRIVTPYGEQHATGPGPFGLAVSPDGNTVVSADGGPGRYSLTLLQHTDNQRWQIRTLKAEGRENKPKDDDDDWRSVFMGLAFDGNKDLYASEGNSGSVRLLHSPNGRLEAKFELNQGGFRDSYSGDLAFDRKRELLYVIDQANFRVAIFDTKRRRLVSSIKVGRLPFALALAPNGQRLYVTNLGMFEYKALPGADAKRPRETGSPKPTLTFPSPEQEKELGSPNAPESNSLAVIDVAEPTSPKLLRFVPTGVPFGKDSLGGASPSGVVATGERVFVSNGHNDSITVIDAFSLLVLQHIPLRVEKLESLRGLLPIGMAFHPQTGWLLVAEAGFNAIAVIDPRRGQVLGHIPAGWFPTRVAVDGNRIWVVNAKGLGTGPNADRNAAFERSFQGELRKGSIQSFLLPKPSDFEALTAKVLENNGAKLADSTPRRVPTDVKYVVLIVKENRTFDEVFGDIENVGNLAVRGAPDLARFGRRGTVEIDRTNLRSRFSQKTVNIAPNHRAIAERWAFSDNFYADSEVSVDGHHWLVGSYPNAWTESTVMAGGSRKDFRLPTTAPGRLLFPGSNSSVHPEEQLEAGALWHHLERNGIPFRNYGEGFELAGIDEGPGLKPTGAAFLTNIPMLAPLYRNTCWTYPGYNTNIPDQYRATQFIADMDAQFVKPGKDLPRFIYIHLPNDHLAKPRAADGYPFAASYMADNDYALGRILDYLSHLPQWKQMSVFITEDDAQGGVDHIDSHRTVFLAAGPWVKRGHLSRTNASFPGLLKTIFRTLGIGPLNLFDALASDLCDIYTDQPDFTPYQLLPVNQELFDPKKAKDPLDPAPSEKMDDPRVVREQHKRP